MFNFENFDIKLNTDFIGRNFIYSEEVDSTNSILLDKENKFNVSGTVLLAEKQNKGKGRKNRTWYSSKGQNLTFSILLNDKKFFGKNFSLINFTASLAVALSLENLFQLKTELKWPNDVLVNGNKIAGILLESSSLGSKIERVVIGIGINVNQAGFQGNFNISPTSVKLEMHTETIERERLLAEVLNNFEEILFKLQKNPENIIRDWKLRCRMLGEKIEISDGDLVKYGIFDDINNDGFLLLKTNNSVEKIHFGDVSLH